MVLDQAITNFHNENEQIAFDPSNLVPGKLRGSRAHAKQLRAGAAAASSCLLLT